MTRLRSRASVVIPAHDEEATIGPLLDELTGGTPPGGLEIVVVANGCTDRTAEVAAGYRDVTVVDLATPSKAAALRAGDAAAATLPRIYLDADVRLTRRSLLAVVEALEAGAPAAAPRPVVDARACSLGVRAYYAVFSRLGYVRSHALGSGVYGMSAAGRARFGEFGDLVADDGFVYSLFAEHERVNPPGATFTIRAPRTLRALGHRRVRIALGNLQLQAAGHRLHPPGPGWLGVVRDSPRLAPAAVVYATVNAVARRRARRLLAAGRTTDWHRDETSRLPEPRRSAA